MLEIKNLCTGYSEKEVLHGVSFTAEAGKITAVIGPNGCGKSTLLKSLCGIIDAVNGDIYLDGESIIALPQNLKAQKISYLAQGRQVPDITVQRLVLHGRFPYLSYPRRYRKDDYLIAEKVMEQLQLTDLADTAMSRLSGGQQQRAYFAMALAQDTDVVLLDEPTTYLDISNQLQVMQQAKALAESGKHIIMVIHDLSHAMETADKIVLMDNGCIKAVGTAEEVYNSGLMDSIFGVKIGRVQIEDKWKYFCTDMNK